MPVANNIFSVFTANYRFKKKFENESEVEIEVVCKNIQKIITQKLEEAIRFIRLQDSFTLHVTVDGLVTSLYSKDLQLEEFVQNINESIESSQDANEIILKLTIYKSNTLGIIGVYSCEMFENYLLSLDFEDLLQAFKNAFANREIIIFNTVDQSEDFNTHTIYFSRNENIVIDSQDLKNHQRTDNLYGISHYGNRAEYHFTPDDFRINKPSPQFQRTNSLFNRLCFIQCVIALFDITNNIPSGINYRLNGYKTITGDLDFNSIPEGDLDEYYRIYKWVYEGGNLSDKIGLARNILSLHLISDSLKLSGNPFAALQSSFEVYLKQNIKQYIEIRNKVFEELSQINKTASIIIETFANNFQKSLFVFVSFFASVIVLRVISKGDFKNLLTLETTILCVAFLVIAAIYLFFSRWELKKQKERLTSRYQNLKLRYEDLLVTADIQRILNNDKEFTDDISFIDDKQLIYTVMWIVTLVILLIAVLLIYSISNLNSIENNLDNF